MINNSNRLTSTEVHVLLQGRTTIVTGSGISDINGPLSIGSATALYFALSGANVLVTDRSERLAENTRSIIRERIGGEATENRVRIAPIDVTDEDSCVHMAALAKSNFGSIDVLVNNVGVAGPPGEVEELDLDLLDDAIDTNVKSMLRATKSVLPEMRKSRRGAIINMSSVASIRAGHHGLAYPITKAAVNGLTTSIAAHVGESGITVNAILPGLVYSPMVANRGLSSQGRAIRRNAGIVTNEGTAWDVAAAAAFLASDAARWITGLMLPVDGGLSVLTRNMGVPAHTRKAADKENQEKCNQ